MAKSKPGDFGARVKKAVEIVTGNAEASDTAEKAKTGINEYRSAEEDKGKAMKAFAGVVTRWDTTHGLNQKAMKDLVRISKMSDEKKADYLRTFLPGLETVLPDQFDLFSGAAEDSKTPSESKTPSPKTDGGAPLQ